MIRQSVMVCSLIAFASTSIFALDVAELNKRSNKGFKAIPVENWQAPDESTIPNNLFGEYVKYGKELVTQTYKYVGPEVANKKMRFAGNNYSCSSCHQEAGTKKWSAPFMTTSISFPQYRNRDESIGSIEERVNGCMTRSMNGKPLPENGKEMRAIVTYMHWLSQGLPVGAKVKGAEFPQIDRKIIMNRAADPKAGAKVYEQHCVACHGQNGEGVKNPGKANGYQYPPLWGKDSYNTGAGMYRVIRAADWIVANMPFGANNEHRVLSDNEAYDVAAYINDYDKKRPVKKDRNKDFPDVKVKVPDSDIAPYMDDKSALQHKFGPYQGIIIPAPKK